jgi:hypothetical protein
LRKHIGQETQLPSLELRDGSAPGDWAVRQRLRVRLPKQSFVVFAHRPLPAEAIRGIVFESLFGEGGSIAERRAAASKKGQLCSTRSQRSRRAARANSGRAIARK